MGDQVGAPLTQRRVSKRLLAQDETDGTNPQKKKAALLGLLGFAVLKILFVDIPILLGDLGSDFCFSWQLYKKSIEYNDRALFEYAVIVASINWFPGIVAAITLPFHV